MNMITVIPGKNVVLLHKESGTEIIAKAIPSQKDGIKLLITDSMSERLPEGSILFAESIETFASIFELRHLEGDIEDFIPNRDIVIQLMHEAVNTDDEVWFNELTDRLYFTKSNTNGIQ